MAATFSRTLRSLETDGSRRRLGALLVTGLVLAWAGWFVLGRVAVYEVSDKTRLEVRSAAHAVASPVGGRVVAAYLTLGRRVEEGDVLLALDAEEERHQLAERRARRDALAARLAAQRSEFESEQAALEAQQVARDVALREAHARIAEAEARVTLAERQAATSARLRLNNAISGEELLRDKAEVEARRAARNALTQAASLQEKDRLVQERASKTRLAKLGREAAELRGDIQVETAAIARLEYDIGLRTIRAPVAGRVGEAAEFRVGSVVRAADKLGALVPAGEARAVAFFPAAAVGRVRPGQPARLRLDGFPWAQYGTVAATVADVGNEPSGGGLVRVELTLAADPASPIPVEHGMPGWAEVEVERVSPAVLLLRAAGQLLTARRAPEPGANERGQP
jgi:membrane fusion protein (multidrug efflux system)